jgi:hypothetical protein
MKDDKGKTVKQRLKNVTFCFIMCLLTYDMYLIPIYQIYFTKTIHALKAVVVFSFINDPALVFSFIDVSFITYIV